MSYKDIKKRMEQIQAGASEEDLESESADPAMRAAASIRSGRKEEKGVPTAGGVLRAVGKTLSGEPSTFLMNAANSALFGYGPELIGKLAGAGNRELGESFRQQAETELQAMQRVDPLASMAGSFFGAVTERGPAGLIGNIPGKAIARAMPKLEGIFARRAGQAALQNLTAGSIAIGAQNLIENRNQADSDFHTRLHDTIHQATSPSNIGMSVVGGLSAGLLSRASVNRELQRASIDFERRTGYRPPIESEIGSPTLRGTMSVLASLPGGRKRIDKLHSDALSAIARDVDILRVQQTGKKSRSELSGDAAKAIREATGTRSSKGKFEKLSDQEYAAGVAASGGPDAVIPREVRRAMLAGIRNLERNRPTIARTQDSASIDELFGRVRSFIASGDMTNKNLDHIRKELAELRNFDSTNMSGRSSLERSEASKLYDVIRNAQAMHMPEMDRALNEIAVLKAAREAAPSEKLAEVDEATISAFIGGRKGFKERWTRLVATSDPQDIDMVKGWYFLRFIDKVVDAKTGGINPKKMNNLLNGSSIFGKDTFNTVMDANRPRGTGDSVVKDVMSRAIIHDSMFGEAGRLRSASQTPMMIAPATIGAIGATAGTLSYLFENPLDTALITAIGATGMAYAASHSLSGGKLEEAMSAVTRGKSIGISSSVPSAIQESMEEQGPKQ